MADKTKQKAELKLNLKTDVVLGEKDGKGCIRIPVRAQHPRPDGEPFRFEISKEDEVVVNVGDVVDWLSGEPLKATFLQGLLSEKKDLNVKINTLLVSKQDFKLDLKVYSTKSDTGIDFFKGVGLSDIELSIDRHKKDNPVLEDSGKKEDNELDLNGGKSN